VPEDTSAPVVLGTVGNYSGPPGVSSLPILEGAQIWVKAVNARGGLKGRPVKLIVYDDGSDPAKHRAQMQDAVERQQVLAFLTNPDPISGAGSVDYVNAKRVPVMGGSTGESYAYTSPMYFVPFTSTPALGRVFAPSIAQQVLSRKMDKVGSLVCAEAPACTDVEKGLEAGAERAGLKDVYKARRSLVQPDFTAECLAARNAGVQVLLITMDGGGVRRIANSCARQSYNPVIAIPGVIQDDSLKDEPSITEISTFSGVFPHFQTGTPPLDEFHAAVKSYAKKGKPSGGLAMGWTSGKLLERAVRDIPAVRLTRETLLAGLWSIKNDNLGGLTYPLTFVENKPAEPVACWFNVALRDGTWASPDGFKLRCD
jgi:branched-chain amino acid transport system substrate-binding protein